MASIVPLTGARGSNRGARSYSPSRHTGAEVHAEYVASIEPWRTETGYAIPGQFVIA
jgi:hypothetical protein